MIGGQYLDTMVDGLRPRGRAPAQDGAALLRVGDDGALGGGAAGAEQAPWRAFAEELGLLFQIVDDILDADGYVREHGAEGARRYADEAAEQARARLAEVDADTSVLRDIVDGLAVRTA